MKFKKTIFILIIAVFLISIAGVCASDVNDESVASQNFTTIESTQIDENGEVVMADENQVIGQTDNQEIISANGRGTFAELEREIQNGYGSTITLGRDYEYEGTGYSNGITIDGPITIDGNGSTIDAKGGARIFNINSINVILKNITFKNGKTKYGGAIYWSDGDYGSVSDCSFVNNTAANEGGAIYLFSSDYCNVSGCSFEDNSAAGDGGAIYRYSGYYGSVSGCSFVNSSAAEKGGAIYLGISVGVNVSGCSFVNNSANSGIIYFNNDGLGRNLNIRDNIFLNNDASAIVFYQEDSTSNADYNWFGHNATNYNNNPNLPNCDIWLFLNTTANPSALYPLETSDIIFKLFAYVASSGNIINYDNAPFEYVSLTVTATNGTVESTARLEEPIHFTATSKGPYTVTATVEDVTQTVEIDGKGAFDKLQDLVNNESLSVINLEHDYIYNEFDTMTDGVRIERNITINGNGHTIDAKGKSRIFLVRANNVIIKNITFINAFSAGNGGAVRWYGCDYGCVFDCIFMNNSARYGGAILWYASDHGNVSGCIFVNNSADYDGGAIDWMYQSDNGSVSGCIFVNNSADGGGAIGGDRNDYGSVSGCIFVNNTANSGVIYFNNDLLAINLNINDNIFLNNDASAIVFNNKDLTSNADYNWFGNNATNYDIKPINTNVEISIWLFLNATANPNPIPLMGSSDIVFKLYAYSPSSGVSEYDSSRLKDFNLTLTPTNGNVNATKVKIGESVRFTPEIAGIDELKAAIENAACTVKINISDGTAFIDLHHIINNNNNGTIVLDTDYTYNPTMDYNFNNGIVIDRSLTIIGNGHTINAAGMARIFHVVANDVTIKNITFANGKADLDGGAIYWYDCGHGSVSDCSFVNNSASHDGGAIMWHLSYMGSVSYCSFVNNSAGNDGGALHWRLSDNGVVFACSFVNNSADFAGAINWDSSNNGAISSSVFMNNSAVNDNGVIYFYNLHPYHTLAINNNAFINPSGKAISFSMPDSTSSAEYNWFGNNATNYNATPIVNNVAINNWLFLNATADPDSILVFETSDVIFKLYSYNSTGISDYDNSKLSIINLTLTAIKADIEGIAKLGETIKFNANGVGNGSVTAKIGNAEYTIMINNIKMMPYISVDPQEVTYSNNTIIAINYNSLATGKVNITLLGKKIYYIFADMDLNATISLGEIDAVEYDVIVTYPGDDYFLNTTATGSLTVNKVNSTLGLDNVEFDYGSSINVAAIVEGVIGIDAKIDGISVGVIANVIPISNLNAGTHTLTVTTIPDENHNAVTKTVNITVNKVNSTVVIDDVEMDYGTVVNATATTQWSTGITAEIDGKAVNVTGNVIAISGLNAGTHTLIVKTIPDENHTAVNKTVTITVRKLNTEITAANKVYVINYGGKYSVTVKDVKGNVLAGKKVTFILNGKNIGAATTNANGVATVKLTAKILKAAKAGKRNLIVKFAGDSNYDASSKTVKITVNKEKTKIAAKKKTFKKAKKIKKYTITLKSGKTAIKKVQVTLKIKGKKIIKAKTNKKGKATFKIKKLTKKGTYKATIKFKGNKYYKAVTKKVKIKIK